MTSRTTNKFSPEVRERAMRLVLDHEADHSSRWTACQSIATKIRKEGGGRAPFETVAAGLKGDPSTDVYESGKGSACQPDTATLLPSAMLRPDADVPRVGAI